MVPGFCNQPIRILIQSDISINLPFSFTVYADETEYYVLATLGFSYFVNKNK